MQIKTQKKECCILIGKKKSEDFTFDNKIEMFQDASHETDKLICYSCRMDLHVFMGTACTWKFYRLMMYDHSSDAEIRILLKSLVRLKQFRLILTSMGFTTTRPIKVYKDNEVVTNSDTYHCVIPRIRHVYILL